MSRFRELAYNHRQRGEARRKSFSPNPTGAPLKLYLWWVSRTDRPPHQENFCHYWRVILIWAPLMWLRRSIYACVTSRKVLIWLTAMIMTAVIVLSVLSDSVFSIVLFTAVIIIGASYVVAGCGYVLILVGRLLSGEWLFTIDADDDEIERTLTVILLGMVFAPFTVLFGLVYAGICTIVAIRQSKAWSRVPYSIRENLFSIVTATLFLAFLVGMLIADWRMFLLIVSGIALVLSLIEAFNWIRRTQMARQEIAFAKQQAIMEEERYQQLLADEHVQAALKVMFDHLYPKNADKPEAFARWRERYLKRTKDYLASNVAWGDLPFEEWLPYQARREIRLLLVFVGDQLIVESVLTTPSRAYVALENTRDFLVLFGQIIRVNKWKICPTVKIPTL